MNKRILVICILAILIALTLSGCMPGNERYTPDKPAGFYGVSGMAGLHHISYWGIV